MSKKLIDNIFDYDAYRYVPQDLKAEWKTLYNLYIGNYFKKQHEIYKIYPQNRIDFYNEEILRLERIDIMCNNFLNKIKSLQPKYNSDIEYSDKMKESLEKSINKLQLFLKNKNDLVNRKVEVNNIPRINDTEHFNQCYDLDSASNNKFPILISIILIILIFYITFYVE
jgi:hypothetical protein